MFQLSRYFSLASGVALVAAAVVLSLLYRFNAVDELVATSERQNVTLARTIANAVWPRHGSYLTVVPVRDGDSLRDREETREIHHDVSRIAKDTAILKVKIYDLTGLTVYSSEFAQIGADKSGNSGFKIARNHNRAASKLTRRGTFSAFEGKKADVDLVATYIPIRHAAGYVEAVFEVYADVSPLVRQINTNTAQAVVTLLVTLTILFGILLAIVRHGDKVMGRQHKGLTDRKDALEQEMTERIRAEESLREQTALLSLLFRLARDLNKARTLEEGLKLCTKVVCEETGWPLAHVYRLADDGSERMEPTGIWHAKNPNDFAAFREITERTSFEKGQGLPGRVTKSGEPAWIRDVTKDGNFPRAYGREDLGLHAAMAFPVPVHGVVTMTVEIFHTQPLEPDETFLHSLAQIGLQLGYLAERFRNEDDLAFARDQLELRFADRSRELDESQRHFRAIFDNMFQFIGLLDLDGVLLEANRTAFDFAGVARDEVIGKLFWETPWWNHDPAQQQRLKESINRAKEGEFVRIRTSHPAADGTLHVVDFSLKPVRNKADEVVYLVPEGRIISDNVWPSENKPQ